MGWSAGPLGNNRAENSRVHLLSPGLVLEVTIWRDNSIRVQYTSKCLLHKLSLFLMMNITFIV